MLSETTTGETRVDLSPTVIPSAYLIGGPEVIALIQIMSQRRRCEVTLTDIIAKGNERIELVLVESNVDRTIHRINRDLSILDEPLRSLVFRAGRVRTYISSSVTPRNRPYPALVFVRPIGE